MNLKAKNPRGVTVWDVVKVRWSWSGGRRSELMLWLLQAIAAL